MLSPAMNWPFVGQYNIVLLY